MVTYHLAKNLSPRTILVFMENHPFESFSPHTFLVFMENPLFPQPGLPWGSNSQEERSVRVLRAGGSPATLRRFPPVQPLSHLRLFHGNPPLSAI